MKLVKYTLVSLLIGALPFQNAAACGSPTYTPGEYYVFRAYEEKKSDLDILQTSHLNILEWQEYTASKATYDDIKDVVYNYAVSTMESLNTDTIESTKLYDNTFVKYLVDNKDKEAIQLLILAKECEEVRSIRADNWWYPTKEDLEYADLKGILERALAYKGTKLKTRHLLQAVRAAYTMNEYDLCIELWNEEIQHQPESVMKDMCEDYIGGIYFQRNDFETAIQHYAKNMQNLNSFWWCADQLSATKSDVDRIKILYKYCPDSPELAHIIEKICREAEDRANLRVFNNHTEEKGEQYGYRSYLDNRKRYIELRDFALQVVAEKRTKDLALWQYTAAFLTMIDGDPKSAHHHIQKAQRMKTTPFLQDNIRILRIMLDALVGSYNASFETRILKDLQWLDKKIENNLTEEITKDYISWERTMFANYSLHYYNDMMRKITLSVMLPQYMKRGKEAKALLLAGMASERLRSLTDYRNKIEKDTNRYVWNIDFYTDVFNAMDTASIKGVIQYKQLINKKNGSPLDRFLAERCYYNPDYLNEIIGTKYMRIQQFDKAIEYLSSVKPGYENSLNIYEYFCYAPFYNPYLGKKQTMNMPDYKLSFASQMLDLQKIIDTAMNNETKAEAMYKYAIGLTQAMNDCWALFRYRRGSSYNYGDDNFEAWRAVPDSIRARYLEDVCNLSANNELKAKCLALKYWLDINEKPNYNYNQNTQDWERLWGERAYALLFVQYDKTDVYRQLMRECDTFYSYIVSN